METSIYDMPFDEVMTLYRERKEIEGLFSNRTALRRRTAMLRQYPELFDDNIMSEVQQAHERAQKVANRGKG